MSEKVEALRKVRREAEKYRAQRKRLYGAIAEAAAVKVPKTHIAEAAKMSREWISQVLKRVAQASPESPDSDDA